MYFFFYAVLTIRFTESEYSVTEGSSVCSGIMIQFRRTQNQFTLRLSAASIQEFEDMFNLSSFIDSGSIEEDARADPREMGFRMICAYTGCVTSHLYTVPYTEQSMYKACQLM